MVNQVAWDIKIPKGISEAQATKLDWKAIAELMGHHQTLCREECGIVFAEMAAHDHPNHDALVLDMIENGQHPDNAALTVPITHTVANTESGLPEIVIINAGAESSLMLLDMIEERMKGDEGINVDQPTLINNTLIQLVPTSFEQLASFTGAYESFIAIEAVMALKGLKPVWLQAVYADKNYRMPWEPGASSSVYQPVPARPERYDSRITGNA